MILYVFDSSGFFINVFGGVGAVLTLDKPPVLPSVGCKKSPAHVPILIFSYTCQNIYLQMRVKMGALLSPDCLVTTSDL